MPAKKEPPGEPPGVKDKDIKDDNLPPTPGEESRPAYEIIAAFAQAYPECFVVYEKYRRPLKVGIHRDLLAAVGDQISEDEILNALRIYVANLAYLKSIRAGAERIDLNGEPAGVVTKIDQADAERRIIWRQKDRAQEEADARKGWDEPRQQSPDGDWARKLHPANAAKPRLTLKGRQP